MHEIFQKNARKYPNCYFAFPYFPPQVNRIGLFRYTCARCSCIHQPCAHIQGRCDVSVPPQVNRIDPFRFTCDSGSAAVSQKKAALNTCFGAAFQLRSCSRLLLPGSRLIRTGSKPGLFRQSPSCLLRAGSCRLRLKACGTGSRGRGRWRGCRRRCRLRRSSL